MSTVYLAYDRTQHRSVALKVLAPDLADRVEFVRRFHREIHLSRRLPHPNLVRGLDVGYDSETGKHYLVLEYVAGPSAQQLLSSRHVLPVQAVVRIGIDVCRALDHLHQHRYIHRDVKPENILLTADGTAKLCDLGLAKRLDTNSDLTAVPHGVGTPSYMPYEQSLNAALVDERSDVFALGATLYHLATGQLPFAGNTPEELSRGKVAANTRTPSSVRPELTPVFDGIVSKALAFDPRSRYQRADEFLTALVESGLGEGPVDAGLYSSPHSPIHLPSAFPTRPDLGVDSGKTTPPVRSLSGCSSATFSAIRAGRTWKRGATVLAATSVALITAATVALAVWISRSGLTGEKDAPAMTGNPIVDRAE